MGKEKNLVKNTFILSIGTLVPKLATFITLPIYTRWLTQTEYGVYDLILTLISLIIPIITLQIQAAVFRNLITEKDENKKSTLIVTSYIFVLCASVIIMIIAMLLFKQVPIITRLLIIAYFLIDTINQLTLQIARGIGFNKKYSINTIINSFLNLVLVLPLLIGLKLGLNGLLLATIIAGAVALFYLVKTTKIYKYIHITRFDFKELRSLLKYSIPLVPNTVSWWVVNSSDKLIVTYVLGIEYNAIYAAASKIPHIYNIMYNAFYMAWQESASLNSEQSDISEYYSNVFKNLYKILSGIMILLIAFTPILFIILLGENYKEAYYQIPILYIAMFLCSFANFYAGIYIAMKKTKAVAGSTVMGAIINLVVVLLLIKIIGLYAASISTLVAYGIITLYRAKDLNKYYKIEYDFKEIIKYLSLIIIACVVCYINNIWLNIINIIFALLCFWVINKNYIKIFYDKGISKLKALKE